jgi:hypothetical protein
MAMPPVKSSFMVFDSIHDFIAAPTSKRTAEYLQNTDSWTGPRNYNASREYFKRGADESEMRNARDLMDKIDVEVHGHVGEQWTPQVYGAYPIVPDYLAGDPLCMRAKDRIEFDGAPLRVVLNIAVAAGMGEHTIARRAAAAAAFAMKLSERRPVELWMSVAVHNRLLRADVGFRVKLDMPMNLSQVIAAFNRSVCRVLMFPMVEYAATGDVNAPFTQDSYAFELKGLDAYSDRERPYYMQAFREYQNLDHDDIVLDAGILTDCNEIDTNPVKWVKDMLAKYGEATED